MANAMAWVLFALGVGHIVYGLATFKAPLAQAIASGFVGQFKAPELRRTAFWFMVFGPLLMLAGHTAIYALAQGDPSLLRLVGFYVLGTSVFGALAFPKTPFLLALPASALLVAASYGWLAW
jgi:hypothetical protein